MKGKYFVAAGLAIIAAGVYLWQKRKKAEPHQLVAEEGLAFGFVADHGER